MQVQAEGSHITATTYDEMIRLLKISHVKRIMTVQSVWEDCIDFIPVDAADVSPGVDRETIINVRTPSASTRKEAIPKDFIGTKQIARESSKKGMKNNSDCISRQSTKSTLSAPLPPTTPNTKTPSRSTNSRVQFVHSPSDMILLSNSWEDITTIEESCTSEDKERDVSRRSDVDGPMIVPINSVPADGVNTSHGTTTSVVSTTEHDIESGLVYRSPEPNRRQDPPSHYSSMTSPPRRSEESIQNFDQSSSSVHSHATAKSSNRKTSLLPSSPVTETPRQSLADQFLLTDGYAPLDYSGTSRHSLSSTEDSEDQEETDDSINSSKALNTSVNDSTNLKNQADLFERNESNLSRATPTKSPSIRLREDFESRLEASRLEQSQTERTLKELYEQTIQRNDIKMDELFSTNQSLQEERDHLESIVHKLRSQLSNAEIDLNVKAHTLEEQNQRLILLEKEKQANVSQLQAEKKKLHDECEANAIALDMSRSMVTDLGQQILALSAERDELENKVKIGVEANQALNASFLEKSKLLESNLTELDNHKNEKTIQAAKIDSLRCQLQDIESSKATEARNANDQLSELRKRLSSKETMIDDYQTTVIKMENALKSAETKVGDLTVQVEQLTKQNSELSVGITQEKSLNANLVEENTRLRDDLSRIKEEKHLLDGKNIKLEDELATRTGKESLLSDENVQLRDELTVSKKRETLLGEENDKLLADLKEAKFELEESGLYAEKLNSQINDKLQRGEIYTEADLAKKDEVIASLRLDMKLRSEELSIEVTKARKASLDLELKLQENDRRSIELGRELVLSASNCSILKSKLANIYDQLNLSKEEVQATKNNAIRLQEEVVSSKSLLTEKLDEILILQQKFEKKEMHVQNLRDENDRQLILLNNQLSTSENEKAFLREEYDRLKLVLESKTHSEIRLSKNLRDMSKSFDQVTKDFDISKQKYGELERQCENFRMTESRLRKEVEELKKKSLQNQRLHDEESMKMSILFDSIKGNVEETRAILNDINAECETIETSTTNLEDRFDAVQLKHEANDEINGNRLEELERLLVQSSVYQADLLRSLETLMKDRDDSSQGLHHKMQEMSARYEKSNIEHLAVKSAILMGIGDLSKKLKKSQTANHQQIESLSSQLFSCREKLSSTEFQFDRLQKDFEKKSKAELELRATVESLEAEVASRESDLQTVSHRFNSELESSKEMASTIQDQYEEQQREKASILQALELTTKEKDSLNEAHSKAITILIKSLQTLTGSSCAILPCEDVSNVSKNTEIDIVILSNRLSSEVSNLHVLLEQYRQSKEEAEQKVQSVNELKETVKSEYDDLITSLQNENRSLQNEIASFNNALLDLQNSKENVTMSACSEVFRLVKRIAVTDAASDLLTEELKHFVLLSQNFAESERLLQARVEELENEIDILRTSTSSSKEVEQKLRNVTIALDIAVSENKSISKKLEESIAEATNDNQDHKIELSILHQRLNAISAKNHDALLKSEHIRTTTARSLLQANAEIASLKVQLKSRDDELSSLHKLLSESEMANSQMEDEIVEFQKTGLDRNEEIAFLRQQIDVLESTIAELRFDLIEKDAHAVKHATLLEQSCKQDLESSLRNKSAEIESLRLDLQNKEYQMSNLESSLVASEKRANETYRALCDSKKSEDTLRHQFDEYKLSILSEISSLTKTHEASLAVANDQVARLQFQADRRLEKLKNLEFDMSSVLGEMATLVDRKEILEDELKSTRSQNHALVEASKNASAESADVQAQLRSTKRYCDQINFESKNRIERLEKQVFSSRVSMVSLLLYFASNTAVLTRKNGNLLEAQKEATYKISSLVEAAESLQEEISSLRADQRVNKLDFDKLAENHAILQEEKNFIESNLTQLEESNRALTADKVHLLEEKKSLELTILDLSTDKDAFAAKIDLLEEDIESLQTTCLQLQKTNTKLNEELNLMESNVSDLNSQNDAYAARIALLEENVEAIDKQNVDLQNTNALLQADIETKDCSIRNMLIENGNIIKKIQDEISSKTKVVEELAASKQKLEDRSMTLSTQCDALSTSLQDMEKQKLERDALIADLQQKLQSTRDEVNDAKSKNDNLAERLSDAISELENERLQNASLVSTEQSQAKELSSLRTLVRTIKLGEAELAKIRNEKDAIQSTNNSLQSLIDESKQEIKNLECKILSLEASCNQLGLECHDKDEEINLLESVKIRFEDQIEKQQEEMASLAQSFEQLKTQLAEKEFHLQQLQRKLRDANLQSSSDGTNVDSNPFQNHLSTVKSAFRQQTELVEDMQLSETVLTDFMNEVMHLAEASEKEILDLSAKLAEARDLQLQPSPLLRSLDLAGIHSMVYYLEDVQFRLDEMAVTANTTCIELDTRKKEFLNWTTSRKQVPQIPVTPPQLAAKLANRALFAPPHVENGSLAFPNDGKNQRQIAGARLLCSVLDNRSKLEVACAFRKWSCCVCATNAGCGHKQTADALAHQLKITREKLMVLKAHLKDKKKFGDTSMERRKPRLRRILEQLDHKNEVESEFLETVFEGVSNSEDRSFVL